MEGTYYVPIPFDREHQQMRTALTDLIAAVDAADFEDFSDNSDLPEALGFARATLALVQPVELSEDELD